MTTAQIIAQTRKDSKPFLRRKEGKGESECRKPFCSGVAKS
jgi:hypothetical protein